jgi:hypothetical protein
MGTPVVAFDFTTWTKYEPAFAALNPSRSGVLQHRDREHHRQCSSKLTTFDKTLVVKLQLAAFCYYKAQVCSIY